MEAKSKRTDTVPSDDSSRHQTPTRSVRVPYVGKISKSFGKRLKSLLDKGGQQTKIIYQTTKVQNWFSLKDPDPKEITSQVVYEFECRGDQDTRYIGYTNRTLQERVKDHLGGKTAVSDHISICTRCREGVTINDFCIMKKMPREK